VRLARLAVHDKAWLRPGDEPHTAPGWYVPEDPEVAVAEVQGDRVRILHDDDDVRVLVWIARADLAQVTVREVELRPGVVLRAGTPITGAAITADGLVVHGEVEPAQRGDLWDAVPPRPDAGQTRTLGSGRPIRAAPDPGADVLAMTTEAIEVRVIGPAARGWLEVETTGQHVVVRGLVERWYLDDLGATFGTGGGSGYGSSHAISIEVPAGTCLYDAIDGEMIGIVTSDRSRLARRTDDDSWYVVLVNSPWGLLDIPIHGGEGSWDRCADR